MKRIIESLLVLCMSVLLCAASSEKASCTCGCNCGTLCNCAKTKAPDINTEYFDFSNIRILSAEKWNKPDKYIMDFDFTCLYPEHDDEQYPNTFELLFSFLDAESVAVKVGQLQVNNMISYGDKVRASSCPHFNASENIITPEELSEIKYVKFTGFTAWTQGAGVKNFKFQDSPVFPLTDTDGPAEKPAETVVEKAPSITTSQKQKTVIKENANAQLAIENFEITEVTEDRFYFKVKLRNITDNTLELSLRYQILDSNRDILTAQLIGTTTDPAAGQAIWAGPYRVDSLSENAAYISFVSSDYEGGTLQEEVLYPLQ